MNSILCIIEILLLLICEIEYSKSFELLLLHNNNINFNFEEDEDNIGGAGRVLHMLNKFRDEARRGEGPPVLYLNAGDNFPHSRPYSENDPDVVAEYLNLLQPDAMCLGNHDLDSDLTTLENFLNALRIPVVGSNVDFGRIESLSRFVKSFHVLTVEDRKIGIIGVTTSRTRIPGMTSKIAIKDEIEAVQREAFRLNEMGVRIIIVLSHSGYDVDETIARIVDHVDVIVSGHRESTAHKSTTFKQVIRGKGGRSVPIIYEGGDMRYLGMLKIYFNDAGEILKFNGEPILLHTKIPEAQEASHIAKRVKRGLPDVLAISRAPLTARCYNSECNLANMITDALCDHASIEYKDARESKWWTNYPIAIINAGAARRRFSTKGPLHYTRVYRSIYYRNPVVYVRIQGQHIWKAIEQGLNWYGKKNRGFLQFSGLRAIINMSHEGEDRLTRLFVRCGMCTHPTYERLYRKEVYNVILNEYLYSGLDGVTAFKDYRIDYKPKEMSIGSIVARYLIRYKTVTPEHDGRLIVYSGSKNLTRSLILILCLNFLLQ